MGTFAFANVQATLAGPGGLVALGAGSGAAEEGISAEFIEDSTKMHVGADGSGMHVLNSSKAGKISIRLLKTSPTNALLMALYNIQRVSAALWGKNVLVVTDVVRGDSYTAVEVAFTKPPANSWGKDGPMLDWEFQAVQMDAALGAG